VEAVDASAIERHASEMKVSALPPISTDAEQLSVSGDNQSPPSSAEPPNRREKLIARLFKKDAIAELEAPIPEKAPRVVRFKEGGVLESSSRSQRPMSNDSSGGDRDAVESHPPSNDRSREFVEPRPPSNDLNGHHQSEVDSIE
jgi:hypothetical protein